MFAALRKTAMSAIIYEVLDMGTGITDGEGTLASSGAGIPSFVGVLDKAVKRVVELNRGAIAAGDVFVTNDPFYEPQLGGWGGSASRDGNSAMYSAIHGHTFNCPAEVAEARYGMYVERL